MPRCKPKPVVVPYAIWKQVDGTEIKVVDMDDHHLFCTIRMLERNAERKVKEQTQHENSVWGEGDDFCFDWSPEHFLKPIYYTLVAVAQTRGIQL